MTAAFLALLLAVPLGFWYLTAKVLATILHTMSSPEQHLTRLADIPDEISRHAPRRRAVTWAQNTGFQDDMQFRFQVPGNAWALICQTWKHLEEKTYLAVYSGMGQTRVEFMTIFDDKTSVATTNAKDGHNMPTPLGTFIQAFPEEDMPALWDKHLAGCATLQRRTGLVPQAQTEDTLTLVAKSMRRQALYLASIPGWKWMGAWWFLVRRQRMLGKDIAWQLDRLGVREPVTSQT